MKELKEDIKNKVFKTCYIFYGQENFLKKAYENKIKDTMIDEDGRLMNLDVYDNKNVLASKIISASETFPFMSDKRLIIIKNSGFFQTGRKEESEKMSQYISKIPESTCLIFIENEVDKRFKLYKEVSKHGRCIEFKTPKENDLVKWIAKEFNKNKIKITSSVALYLIRTVGGEMESVISEIDKLSSYKGRNGEVTTSDIDDVCIKAFETKIFDLVAAVGNKNSETALKIYRNMIIMKEPPIKIFAMIIRQFRLIFQCGILINNSENISTISQKLGQREFVVRECVNQSKNFSKEILEHAIEDCLQTDISIKTGKMDGELAVEVIIIKYSSRK